MQPYPHLFSSLLVRGRLFKNRLVMAPMLAGYTINGEVSERMVEYYLARAQGGVGAIIVEAACIDPAGLESHSQMLLNHPRYIAGLEHLADTIKINGVVPILQIFHTGAQTSSDITGQELVAPSPVACPMIREMPRELTLAEIKHLEDQFVQAAEYASRAGFEGVELHAAHGYLINEFLSPNTNLRNDEYGGSLQNRERFLLNIVRRIRAQLPDLIISVRLNMDDFVDNGFGLEESLVVARHLEKAGIDLLHCSCGTYASGLTSIEPGSYPEGWRGYMSAAAREKLSIPVIGGGVVSTPQTAEQMVASGQADLVFLGRSLLADPQWPDKVKAGREADIRPCLLCNRCIEANFQGLSVRCSVNFWTGREGQRPTGTVAGSRSVTVVGGGPAGMQAALALDRLGIEVTLYERENRLGGLLNLAVLPPHKDRLARYLDYLVDQVNRSGISLRLGQSFGPADWNDHPQDILILATGSCTNIPAITGIDHEFCVTLEDVLERRVKIENSRVVIIGGGSNGCETADFLIAYNNNITVVEMAAALAANMEKKNRRDLLNRLKAGGVHQRLRSSVVQIKPGEVEIECGGKPELLAADFVIITTGYTPEQNLYRSLQSGHREIYLIGDAHSVGGVRQAVAQAESLAERLYKRFKEGY